MSKQTLVTSYEVCTTCRCALANNDCSGMSDTQYIRYLAWYYETNDFLVTTDERGLGDSCEACGYSDYEGDFWVVTGHDKGVE